MDDPFYGFNEGSTHVRVGAHNQPLFHRFESPLLRLLHEEGYKLLVKAARRPTWPITPRFPPIPSGSTGSTTGRRR